MRRYNRSSIARRMRLLELSLAAQYPDRIIHNDVLELRQTRVDCVAGGWPCQDLTVAGRMGGIHAPRSRLFFEMVQFARRCGAKTVIGEERSQLASKSQRRGL